MAVPAGAGWEVHFDAEAAACAELDLEAGVMGGGDRADNGQAEPMTIGVAGAVRADPLKWLEEPADLVFRNRRPGVGDSQDGVVVTGLGVHLDVASGQVITDCVVNQVGGHPLGQVWIPVDGGMAE